MNGRWRPSSESRCCSGRSGGSNSHSGSGIVVEETGAPAARVATAGAPVLAGVIVDCYLQWHGLINITIKNTGFGTKVPGFDSSFCHLLAMPLLENYLTSLGFHFFLYKVVKIKL